MLLCSLFAAGLLLIAVQAPEDAVEPDAIVTRGNPEEEPDAPAEEPEQPPPLLAGENLIFQPDNLPVTLLLTALDLTEGRLHLGVGVVPSEDPALEAFSERLQQAAITRLKSAGKDTVRRVRALPSPPTAAEATARWWTDAAFAADADHVILLSMVAAAGTPVAVEVTAELRDGAGTLLKSVSALNVLVPQDKADQPAISKELRSFYARAWSVHTRRDVYVTMDSRGMMRRHVDHTAEVLDEDGERITPFVAAYRLGGPVAMARGLALHGLVPGLLLGGAVGCVGIAGFPLLMVLLSGAVLWPLAYVAGSVAADTAVPGVLVVAPLVIGAAAVAPYLLALGAYVLGGYYVSEMAPRWLLASLVRQRNEQVAADVGVDLQSLPPQFHPSGWDDGFELSSEQTAGNR